MRIYTRTGDDGTTGLLYGGRISKADPAAEAYGTTDEAVAALGLARAMAAGPALRDELLALQRELFVVGADLATNPEARGKLRPGVSLVTSAMVAALEERIDAIVAEHPLPRAFVVPGANPVSAALDLARAVVASRVGPAELVVRALAARIAEGDDARLLRTGIRRLLRAEAPDAIAVGRRVAEAVLAADGYPLDL